MELYYGQERSSNKATFLREDSKCADLHYMYISWTSEIHTRNLLLSEKNMVVRKTKPSIVALRKKKDYATLLGYAQYLL